jgi:predicted alpha/beta-hydrolase family hydrolase
MKPKALLLTPGAGANREQATLVAIDQAVQPMPVERMDFPYRKAGRRAPDRAPVAIAAIREEAAVLVARAHTRPGALALGGRSFGGRMCSMAVAEGLPAAALVLLSYPLHPPGKPDTLRVEHFADIAVPCLFVSGTKDPFGTPAELEHHSRAIAGPVTHVWIDGAGHDPRRREPEIAATVRDWLRSL